MAKQVRPKTSSPKLNSSEKIKELAYKKGVTILLDMEGTTQEAKINSVYSYSRHSKTLTIVAPILEVTDKPLLLEIIKKVFTSGGLIWKKGKEEALELYQEYNETNKYQNVIKFFSNLLSRADFNALKMAFFIRDEKEKGRSVSVYKNDIRERYGERGSNIANLCTAGYFESEFMPLYNSGTPEEFQEYYEIAVGQKARALFVHGGMSKEDIEAEFNKTLDKALKFHIENFRIHGMGNHNVETIKDFISSIPVNAEDKFIIKKDYEKKEPTPVIGYTVTIIQK